MAMYSGGADSPMPETNEDPRTLKEKVFNRVRKQSSLLLEEADGLSEELIFPHDTYVRDLLRTKTYIDIDIKRIFRVISG